MKIYHTQVNHLENPIGFRMERTVFSWKVKESKGKKQSYPVESVSVLWGQEYSGRPVYEHEIVGGLHYESRRGQPRMAVCLPLR